MRQATHQEAANAHKAAARENQAMEPNEVMAAASMRAKRATGEAVQDRFDSMILSADQAVCAAILGSVNVATRIHLDLAHLRQELANIKSK